MKNIKLFEEFNSDEFEQEEIIQRDYSEEEEEEEEEVSEESLTLFEEIIELLSDIGDVEDDVEIEDDECEFVFNGIEFELKLEGDVVMINSEVDDISDSIGSFKKHQVEKIVDAIVKYKVS